MSTLDDQYTAYDAMGLAELVRRGETNATELLNAAIARTEAVNRALNAVVLTDYRAARGRAASGDAPRGGADALQRGPLYGVPYLVKDLNAPLAGLPMSNGSRHYRYVVPDTDGLIVARSKTAGLNIFGKTNTPELGQTPYTEPELFGACRNPWDLDHTPGGSSGGAGAAVAAGIVPIAHASDGGGSIRIPASCCGLFGFKPSRDVQDTGVPMPGEFSVHHAISRSVRDSALLLDQTCRETPLPAGAPGTFLAATREACPPLRIALAVEPMFAPELSADVRQALDTAAQLAESLGHRVEEVSLANLDFEALAHAFLVVWSVVTHDAVMNARAMTGRMPRRDEFEATTWAIAQVGGKVGVRDLPAALALQRQAAAKMEELLSYYDVLLTPTLASAPVKVGALQPTGFERFEMKVLEVFPLEALMRTMLRKSPQKVFAWAGCTELFNLTGQPAMSVPMHWNARGLPIGVQFAARIGGDALLFRVAAQLEQARPWFGRRPWLGSV